MTGAPWWSPHPDGVVLRVRATPGARRSAIVGTAGDQLRVAVAAPAVEGKANAALERFLAERFGVRPTAVRVLRGERGRAKVVLVAGVDEPPGSLVPD